MPYKIKTNSDGTVRVVNEITGQVKAASTTKEKAEAQVRLLNAKDHGWTPGHKWGHK